MMSPMDEDIYFVCTWFFPAIRSSFVLRVQSKMAGYIYMLHEREFIRLREDVYKIGLTKRPINDRVMEYPIGSRLLLCIHVEDCVNAEIDIMNHLQRVSIPATEFGT